MLSYQPFHDPPFANKNEWYLLASVELGHGVNKMPHTMALLVEYLVFLLFWKDQVFNFQMVAEFPLAKLGASGLVAGKGTVEIVVMLQYLSATAKGSRASRTRILTIIEGRVDRNLPAAGRASESMRGIMRKRGKSREC